MGPFLSEGPKNHIQNFFGVAAYDEEGLDEKQGLWGYFRDLGKLPSQSH
jgi:hypothetical protein